MGAWVWIKTGPWTPPRTLPANPADMHSLAEAHVDVEEDREAEEVGGRYARDCG